MVLVVFCFPFASNSFTRYMVTNIFKCKITIVLFKTDRISAFLYLPYVIWLCFASYLNLFIVINN